MKKTAIFLFWCRTPRLKASHELELVESEGLKVLYQTHTGAVQKFSQSFFFFFFGLFSGSESSFCAS
jgi:hypothetical protein